METENREYIYVHIMSYVHVNESLNVKISADKALYFALADDSSLLSILLIPFERTTWFLHVAVRDGKLIMFCTPLSCGLVS